MERIRDVGETVSRRPTAFADALLAMYGSPGRMAWHGIAVLALWAVLFVLLLIGRP